MKCPYLFIKLALFISLARERTQTKTQRWRRKTAPRLRTPGKRATLWRVSTADRAPPVSICTAWSDTSQNCSVTMCRCVCSVRWCDQRVQRVRSKRQPEAGGRRLLPGPVLWQGPGPHRLCAQSVRHRLPEAEGNFKLFVFGSQKKNHLNKKTTDFLFYFIHEIFC